MKAGDRADAEARDKARDKAGKRPKVDERGRRRNAAKKARKLAEKRADSMPVVAPLDGPRQVRVVDAPLVPPAPSGGLREVLGQRYLLRLIVGRELAKRYAASVLGLLWSYIQPTLRFIVYYFIFGYVLMTHAGTPMFALRLFTGIVVVHYFTETWAGGTRSIWANKSLVLKMRVPREIFPIASMLTAAYHTGPQLLILVIACAIVGWHVTFPAVIAGLLGLAILVTFSMALALIFSALNVFARDFQNIVTTITQFTHFLVPMMYPFSMIYSMHDDHPVVYQIYMANPISVAVVLMQKLFWFSALDADQQQSVEMPFPPDLWTRGVIVLIASLILLWLGQRLFSRLESKFAERL